MGVLQCVITPKAGFVGLKRSPEKENVLEQGLPAVGAVQALTDMPGRLYVRLSTLLNSFFNDESTEF